MKSFVSIFEIPAVDITRAVNFYKAILDIEIQLMDMGEIKMGLFPVEDQATYGVIVQGDGNAPSQGGVTIY